MLVKCCVRKYETIEVEIPDEYRKLAVPYPWTDPNITNEDIDRCIDAVEKATGIPVDDDCEKAIVIEAVWSAENGETMLEM